MLTKNGKDLPLDEVTAENYIVPKGEEHLYHCVIEQKNFCPKTGTRLSVPALQKFGRKGFETMLYSNLKKLGYDVVILHNPNQYEAQAAAQAEAARQAEMQAQVAQALNTVDEQPVESKTKKKE